MSWGTERRALIILILTLVGVALVSLIAIATLFEAPSCMDEKQNQDETGIDCGGPCNSACTSDVREPVVSAARPLVQTEGRTDVIVSVENQNVDAVVDNAPYVLELFDANNALLATYQGTIDLPAGERVSVYVPGAYFGDELVAHAFLTFDTDALIWVRSFEPLPRVLAHNVQLVSPEAPRVQANIENESAYALKNVKVVATVYDAAGNAIAASQTVLVNIPAQGSTVALFTWNNPFSATASRVDVRPVFEVVTP